MALRAVLFVYIGFLIPALLLPIDFIQGKLGEEEREPK
jgi:hypothetical protein